jgi:hypothetical protein
MLSFQSQSGFWIGEELGAPGSSRGVANDTRYHLQIHDGLIGIFYIRDRDPWDTLPNVIIEGYLDRKFDRSGLKDGNEDGNEDGLEDWNDFQRDRRLVRHGISTVSPG